MVTVWCSDEGDSSGRRFQVLTRKQMDRIHWATLEVMERTGCRIFHEEAVALLKKAGAHVSDGNRVRIAPGLVEKALVTVPKRVVLCDRSGRRVMPLEPFNIFFGVGGDCLNILDSRTGERRKPVLQDVVEGMQVCEAMPHIDFVMSMFTPSDVPARFANQYQMEAMLLYSRKPIVFEAFDVPGCIDQVQMAAEVAGDMDELRVRPQIACYANVTSALRHNSEAVGKLLYMAEQGLPVMYIPSATRGMSAPMTLAGAMVISNAGHLTGLVLSQLKREGTPFMRGHAGTTMDMRTMVNPYVAPEGTKACCDLARYYGLPVFGVGGCSDSKILDEQATAEAALTLLRDARAGANLIHDVGYLQSGLMTSFELIAVCDDIIGWIRRHTRPIEINDETLALDIIDQVGPDGNFFETEHTMRHFREDWYPRFVDRRNYGDWVAAGTPRMVEKAHDKVMEIISAPAVTVIPPEVAERVRAVRQRAQARPAVAAR